MKLTRVKPMIPAKNTGPLTQGATSPLAQVSAFITSVQLLFFETTLLTFVTHPKLKYYNDNYILFHDHLIDFFFFFSFTF